MRCLLEESDFYRQKVANLEEQLRARETELVALQRALTQQQNANSVRLQSSLTIQENGGKFDGTYIRKQKTLPKRETL